MLKKILVIGCLFALVSVSVFADQAAWIDKKSADKAGKMIRPGMVLRKFCAPCGNSMWSEVKADKVETKPRDKSHYEVEVNGEGIDLAYMYIPEKGKWKNLAMLVGLKVSGVPRILTENPADAETEGEEEATHPTDKFLEDCIAKNDTTAGMADCISRAYDLWDAELNKNYKQLKTALNPDQKKKLGAAQSAWIKYRDKEFKLTDSVYSSLEGTMYVPMRLDERLEIVRKRAITLGEYSDLLKNR